MTKTTQHLALLVSLLALVSLACQQPADNETSPPAPDAGATTEPSSSTESEPAIEYEPAYPTDVSSEALSESDVAQQEATHSHDGGDDHSHDGGEDHSHDDGGHEHDDGSHHDHEH